MTPYLQLIGQIAWPVAALIIMVVVLKEIRGGIISKIIPPGGSLSYGELTISREIEEGREAIATADVPLETPLYTRPTFDRAAETLTPYEMVMTAYSGMASALAEVAEHYDGWNVSATSGTILNFC